MSIRVAGIVGSLREGSLNKGLLRAAAELAPAGMEIEIYTRLGDIPPYNDDVFMKGDPEPVADLKNFIGGADALLISTPEYNYGVPGVLKNAIDWASRPSDDNAWSGKPVAVIGASVGRLGTARAQYHLRQVFVTLNMYALNQPEAMISNASELFDAEGNLTDEKTRDHVRRLLNQLALWTCQLRNKRRE